MQRIAIVDANKCKPKKCAQECKKTCPVVRQGKQCIDVSKDDKLALISENLCIGCNICVKKCPFKAIQIINLPRDLENDVIYRYGPNTFKLHRLPMPKIGQVLGLIGTNGIGKTTALKILAGKLKCNFGNDDANWKDILTYFRGSDLQNYFTQMLEEKVKIVYKPQYVDSIPKVVKGIVKDIFKQKSEVDDEKLNNIIKELSLENVLNQDIELLSGGELQRFTIAIACIQKADVYIFDEPSSYLDIFERLKVSQIIRSLAENKKYVIVVEHDLSVLDYLSDYICCLYGEPGVYGVISSAYTVREGINVFLAGFIPTENLRFRNEELSFKISLEEDLEDKKTNTIKYPEMKKSFGENKFELMIEAGEFSTSQITVMLGRNGTGKTTFIRMLAGLDKVENLVELKVGYKPQKINPTFEGTVEELLRKKIPLMFSNTQFHSDVMKPMKIPDLLDLNVKELSGGELQRVAITICLGTPADVYLIDEPSAYLDCEQRLITAKVLKRFILHSKKSAFIVEHDFIMATYLADKIVVFDGIPAVKCIAHSPQSLEKGMNMFLKELGVTFRRDPTNFRPRINKLDSVKDKEQKLKGDYFCLEE